jgi:uncharacterized protein (DUF58 family)
MAIRRWLLFLTIIFYLGIVLGSAFLVALSSTLIIIMGLSYWWQKHSLDGVIYKRRFFYTRAFPGEVYPVRIEIENRKLMPLSWLRVQDSWPEAVGPENENILAPSYKVDQGLLTHLLSLRWYERTRRSYDLLYRKRGVYNVGPTRFDSGDLFGIYENSKRDQSIEELTVFPQLIPMEKLSLPAEDPFGDQRSRRRLFEDPNRPMGVREYHPEDSFRRVHWPATARTGQIQVKVYQPTSARVMVLCLNVSTYPRYWEGVYPALLERLISVAATLVDQAVGDGYRVGMISNGCLANSDQPFRIPPGRSPRQLTYLLRALAGVSPVVVSRFESYLLREIPRVSYGATLLILTAVTSLELGEVLLRLKKHERKISLLSLAQEPPPSIPGLQCIHMPFEETDEGFLDHEMLKTAKGEALVESRSA